MTPVKEAARRLLSVGDRALRANERAIAQLRLRVRAWQLALDPETRPWITTTKQSIADGSIEQEALSADELRRRFEARRDLSA